MKKQILILLSLILVACGKEKEVSQPQEKVKEEKKAEVEIEKEGFQVVNISTTSGNNPTVDITMSEEIIEDNLEGYIKIYPDIKYKIIKMRDHIIITGNFDINKDYEIEFLEGMKGKNSRLSENNKLKVSFKELEPKLTFSNEGIILPKNNENKVAFRSVNIKKVKVEVKKIYLNNITQFLQDFKFKGNGNIFDYYIQNNLYKVGDTVFEKDYDLEYEKNIWKHNIIDLGKIIKEKGIYILELSFDKDGIDYKFPENINEWQKNYFFDQNGKIGKAILVSDMGIIAQQEKDGNIIVAVLDVNKNKGVEDVNLRAISVNNQLLGEKKTDKNGEVVFQEGEKIFYILAEKDGEFSILKLSDSKLSYDGFLVDGEFSQDGARAFIYSDRGIYRPGDTINISIIAKDKNGNFPKEQPIKLDVFTPRGEKYIDGKILKDGKEGFFTCSFETQKNSETGIWEIVVYIDGNTQRRFSLKVPVETVVPYKIEVNTKFEPLKKGAEKIQGEVDAKYLFGTVAEGLKYSSELSIRSKNIEFERFKKFTFSNPTSYIPNFRDTLNGSLDKEGKDKIEFNISKGIPNNISLIGDILTRVIENGGRAVLNNNSVEINEFDNYVGIEVLEDRYIKTGEALNLQVINVDKAGEKLVAGRKMKYRVYKNEYSWWWDYYDYNNFIKSIKTDKNTVLLYEKEFESGEEPYVVDYQISGTGEIFVEVEDLETHQSAGINLYASTWQDSSTSKRIDKLKLESDKKSYDIGEKAKITFEGEKGNRALVTVEKSGEILERYWKEVDGEKTTIELDVKKEFFPNAYVTVALFQNYEDLQNDRPLRLYGAVPIIINDDSKRLDIEINTPLILQPGEKFKLEIENLQKEKMNYTISVVDEGLLQVTDYKTPDPYNYFYQKEGLQLLAYDNYSEIIGKISGEVHQILTPGGDNYLMSAERMNKKMNDLGFEQSERFVPLAIFKGILTTDDQGKGSVELELPNYTGAIRVMVTGNAKEKYGAAEKKIEVKAPIIANLSLPRSLKVGDKIQVPVKVFVLEDDLGEIELSLKFLGREYKQKINLKKDESKDLFFDLEIGNEIGNKIVELDISSEKYSNKEKINIDIASNNPYIYTNNNFYLENGEKSFNLPKDTVKGSLKGKLSISRAPILGVDNRINELIRYPYGCLEQTVSTVFPQLFIEKLSTDNEIDKKKIVKNINTAISKLVNFQLVDGSFAYWAGNQEPDLWTTNYVGQFLVMAKDKGYFIPEDLFNRWSDFAIKQVKDFNYNIDLKAYTLYVLTMAGKPQIGELNYIYENNFEEMEDISKWYLATSYSLIGETEIAREIADKLPRVVEKKDSNYYDEAIILNLYYIIYGQVEKELYSNVLKLLQSNKWLSTQSLGYLLMSLAQVVETQENLELNGSLIINGEEETFDIKGIYQINIDESIKTLKVKGKDLFINEYWEGIPVNFEKEDESYNLRLERKFYADNGKEIDINSLEAGTTFYMELKVLPTKDIEEYFSVENVALTQIIPSGWEIENLRALNLDYPEWIIDKTYGNYLEYEDIRDDRVNFFFDYNNYNKRGQSYFVKLNAVTKGEYELPGATLEAMYDNNYRAYLKGQKVEVK